MKKNNGNFNPFDYPEIKELFGVLLDRLFTESGRGALLIATTLVDEHLTKLIESILPFESNKQHKEKLFKYPGQLSSFSSRIELAYAFRLISKTLYDSLNALRKVRNDAAHSPNKFELHELNEKLKLVYNLGPGFSNFIKNISTETIVKHKLDIVKDVIDKSELDDKSKQQIFEDTIKDKEGIAIMEKQVPFLELSFGLSFLCGMMSYEKHNIMKLKENMTTIGSLVNRK